MELRAALQHAVALAGTSGVVGLAGVTPAHVLTYRNSMVCSIALDEGESLPWGVVEARALSAALRDVPGDLSISEDGKGFVVRANGAVSWLQLADAPMPTVPSAPKLRPVEQWDVIARVFHAAGGASPERPELGCVRFGEDVTEATDSARIARADVGIGHGELIHASSFDRLRSETAHVAFGETHAFFQFGDELRVCGLIHSWYPSLHSFVPTDEGARIRVAKKPFEKAVARAGRAATKAAVKLRIVGSGSHLSISRLPFATKKPEFETIIEIHTEDADTIEFVVNGKMLRDAVKVLPGQEITIVYPKQSNRPLRFEADRYIEVLYPLADL